MGSTFGGARRHRDSGSSLALRYCDPSQPNVPREGVESPRGCRGMCALRRWKSLNTPELTRRPWASTRQTDRSSKQAVDVAFTIPGGPISSRHPPPQHPARRAWSVLRFSEAPASTSTRRWQAARASSLNDLQPAPFLRVLAVLISPDPAARAGLTLCLPP
jgi:hypothetical protein